ncbi:MAG: diaminopimelate epimerase [Myxococcota bacterium]|jgi:diaminopimelate epimerase|nr:diaminopimelate epimerase [Deltaproteobacteria bacterium]MCP4239983.1 diaminopimelate epimerase [bacterium]MDP6075232.1 diaminopimelate epimerase [Myxococcota bacterium]MDP6243971.1 diaminopimelate epimerase [Myxococcota bacterium]MDP7075001.1 diaminopimelate epimerase [Myxococcota bacterium]
MRNGFFKGHGLGNDYLVVDPEELDFELTPKAVRGLCDRHRGVGADGVLALAPSRGADFGLRVYNPDGSEAERSGNGLRIFGRYLFATGRTRRTRFRVATRAGPVAISLHLDRRGEASRATVEMGSASFAPRALPCTLRRTELVDIPLTAARHKLRFTGVSVGNPHCVVFAAGRRKWRREDLLELGPALERHRVFPRRTNVQLARVAGPGALEILVWERGAGETAASGTSACAAACAAVRRGLLKSPVRVRAPGGLLRVAVGPGFEVTLDGPVAEVARGRLVASLIRDLA